MTASATVINPLVTVAGPTFYVDGVPNNIFSRWKWCGDTIAVAYTLSEPSTVTMRILDQTEPV